MTQERITYMTQDKNTKITGKEHKHYPGKHNTNDTGKEHIHNI